MKKTLLTALFFIAFIVVSGNLNKSFAADVCWDGGGSTNNWSEDANWAGDVEPDTDDVAVFDNTTCTGNPNKNAVKDVDEQSYTGINIVSYTGTISLGSNSIGLQNFNQASGTFDQDTGGLIMFGSFTRTGGIFEADQGLTAFLLTGVTLSGSTTFNDVLFATFTGENTNDIAAGTIFTILGELSIDGTNDNNDSLNGPGEIHAQGDVLVVGGGLQGSTDFPSFPGDIVITINGSGTQTLDGELDNDSQLPAIVIDKPLGTLNITDTIMIGSDFTYMQGIVNPGTSKIIFILSNATYDGSVSLNDVTFKTSLGDNDSNTIASGTTITALGDLVFDATYDGNDSLSGPGGLAVEGDFAVVTSDFEDSDVPITMTGTNDQSITLADDDILLSGTFTINKQSGTATLLTDFLLGSGQDLIISSGILNMSSFSVLTIDVLSVNNGGIIQGVGLLAVGGNTTIGSSGWWINNSTGDFSTNTGTTLTNNGYVRLDGINAGCGSGDGITISPTSGSANLAGTGRWRVYDVSFSNMAASPGITVYSSTNTTGNSGITFTGTCPTEVTWDGDGGDSNYSTASNWTGNTLPSSSELAVFDATSTKSATLDIDPNDNGFQLNNGFDTGTITQSNGIDINLDDQGWSQNAGTFTGGDSTSDIALNNGGDFTISGGLFTTPGGTITISDDFTNSGGTFSASAGTVEFYPGGTHSPTVTGSTNFFDVSIAEDSFGSDIAMTIAGGTTLTVNGTLTFYNNNGGDVLNGPGNIEAKGDIDLLESGWNQGDIVITINGSGTQTITGDGDGAFILSTVINKTGTLNLVDTISPANDWTYTQGTISPGSSTVAFQPAADNTSTITGSHALNNVYFFDNSFGAQRTVTIAAGTVLTANGDLTFQSNNGDDTVTGSGTIAVQGDIETIENGWTVDNAISLTGTAAQTITDGASNFPDGTIFVNKPLNTVTLASALNLNASGQDLQIQSGTLSNSSYNLTVNDSIIVTNKGKLSHGTGNVTAGTYNVGPGGIWENLSTGDIVVGSGGVINNGLISFGDIQTCGEDDEIAITSSSGGNQRSWSGNGGFELFDVSVQDQGGSSSIIAFSSTSVLNNDTNWTFNGTCPTTPPGTRIRGGGVTIRGGTRIP